MLPVVETFHSVQGEGYWAGTNAFFIRLAGCNVGCSWCDTKHSWSSDRPLVSVSDLIEQVERSGTKVAVITGGEPLLHDLTGLTAGLGAIAVKRHLETSGTQQLTGKWDWITLSPKPHKPPLQSVASFADELKVVITSEDDLAFAERQQRSVFVGCHLLLQPEWSDRQHTEKLVYDYTLKHPEWRISLQTHKFMRIR